MKQYVCEKCCKPVTLSDKFCGHCGAAFLEDAEGKLSRGKEGFVKLRVPKILLERVKS